jgi:hypothetical protein
MQLTQIIGIGRYRECYAIANTDLCCKKVKPFKIKFRSMITHYFRDINQEEFNVYKTIPDELKSFFPGKIYKRGDMLVTQRPKDYDHSYSKSLLEYGKISDNKFWSDVDEIAEQLIKHKLWLFDVFHLGNNIIVQRVSKNIYKPIIIDCKRFGYFCYPLQVNLILDSEKEKKLNRRLERFKNIFKTT